MVFICECKKTYKTERGYLKHKDNCSAYLSSIDSDDSIIEDIQEEIVEEVVDLMKKLCPQKISMEVEENVDSDEDVCYCKSDFIMKSVFEKKMKYLQKQLFKQHLPKRRYKAYRKMIKKLNKKTVL